MREAIRTLLAGNLVFRQAEAELRATSEDVLIDEGSRKRRSKEIGLLRRAGGKESGG